MDTSINGKSILLIISGGIAAYKSLELIRLLRKSGVQVRCILTEGGAQFITPLSIASLSEEPVYTDLWSLKDETEMGHISLSRESDLVVVAPASADIIAKMAQGRADDLASTTLLATDKPVLIAPAMNHRMWTHPATQDNIHTLHQRGILQIGPEEGDMACGEYGPGRMAEPNKILEAVYTYFQASQPLAGLSALVTSGPTYEPIDPVRFISNRSSGKQGHAVAQALAEAGACVTLITGPVALSDPDNVTTVHIETAEEMLNASKNTLPADIAVFAAAVGDWAPDDLESQKIKKKKGKSPPDIQLKENPDILETISKARKARPQLIIGFAAETHDTLKAAQEKLKTKGCDWIVANTVGGQEKVFGTDENQVYLVSKDGTEEWPRGKKTDIARKLVRRIINHFGKTELNIAAE